MLDRERLRNRLEIQLARDDTRRRHWRERREQRIERGMEDPLLPALCRLCLIGMAGGALMAFTGDLIPALRRGAPALPRALQGAAASALAIWLLFGAPLALGCAAQLKRGFTNPWFGCHCLRRSGAPRMPWAKKYKLWIAAFAAGAVLWLGLWAAAGAV